MNVYPPLCRRFCQMRVSFSSPWPWLPSASSHTDSWWSLSRNKKNHIRNDEHPTNQTKYFLGRNFTQTDGTSGPVEIHWRSIHSPTTGPCLIPYSSSRSLISCEDLSFSEAIFYLFCTVSLFGSAWG